MARLDATSLRAWWVVAGCLVCQLGAGFFYGTRALAPDVIGDLGWTRTMWSSAMAPMLFVSSLSQAFVGIACARFGVRAVLVTSVAFLGVSLVTLSAMQSLWHLYAAMAFLALGNAGIGDVSIGSVITKWFDRARGVALGFAYLGSNAGGVIFVYALTALSGDGAWRDAALWVGLVGVAVILPFAVFVVREPRNAEAVAATAPPDEPVAEAVTRPDIADSLRSPAFWALFYVLFCYAFAQLGLADHLILYLTDTGFTRDEAATALELALGAGILAKLGAGVIALRLSARTALAINTLLLTAAVALMPFAGREGVLPVIGVLFGVSTAARDVLFPLLVADVFGIRRFAQVFGALMVAFFPGGAGGPLLLAFVHDSLGSYEIGFLGIAVLLAGAVVAVWAVPRLRSGIETVGKSRGD